jgi:transposase
VKSVKKRFRITAEPVRKNITRDERCDGMFPLITNTSLTPEEVLQNYKYQPRLEKRNEQMKSVYSLMPMLFKRIDRIEGFLFMFFIAMLIEALIERSVRLSMKSMKIESIPIYHERKECESPTADRLLSIFSNLQFHRLLTHERVMEVF